MDDSEIKYRVDNTQKIFLISASLMTDAIQAMLNIFAIGFLLTPFAGLFFLTWFYFLGIKFTKGGGKNLGVSITTFIIEMIPYVNILPGWTVSTIILIANSRKEDQGKKSTKKKKEVLSKKTPGVTVKTPAVGIVGAVKKNQPVGAEIKTKGSSAQDKAGKELEATQTTGTKTAEQKTAEASPEAQKEKPKEATQPSKKEEERETEPGEIERGKNKIGEKRDELYDTRTSRYKKQQEQFDQTEELAEFEDLPLQKGGGPILNEWEGGQDKQEFSMGDPYREPQK